MSTLLTHAVAGVLVGLVLRLRFRHLPFAAFLAIVVDIEKFTYFFFDGLLIAYGRSVLHNVWVTILLPLVVYLYLRKRDVNPEYRRLALASPLILSSHLLLDIVPLEPYGRPGWALILYPFTRDWFGPGEALLPWMSPVTTAVLALLAVVLVVGAGLTLLAMHFLEPEAPERVPSRKEFGWRFGAFAVAWMLLTPVLLGTDLLAHGPPRVEAELAVDAPTFHVVDGRFTATVQHAGGMDAPADHLALGVWRQGVLVATFTNPTLLQEGETWEVREPLSLDLMEASGLSVQLTMNTFVVPKRYATKGVTVDQGYLGAPLAVTAFEHDGARRAFVTLQNRGAVDVPAGALDVGLTDADGRRVGNVTNALPLQAGGEGAVAIELPATSLTGTYVIEVHAAEFAHTYAREERAPSLNPAAGVDEPATARLPWLGS